jgi:hypothetical protein
MEIVVGEPKQSAAVGRAILARVIDVDVDHVPGQRPRQVHPPLVARAEVLEQKPQQNVELIVVVRDQRLLAVVVLLLVVGVQIAPVPPAVFINPLAIGKQAARGSEKLLAQLVQPRQRRRVGMRPVGQTGYRRRRKRQRLHVAGKVGRRFCGLCCRPKLQPNAVRLLLAPLKLVHIGELTRK